MAPDEASNNSSVSPSDGAHGHLDNAVPHMANNCVAEPKDGISQEDVKGVIEVIASNGKFWHDWEKLRGMLSFQLKQVLSLYPEARMTTDEQNASLGETYPELVKRLDEELSSFDDGPPFTLQRLCEILLSARSIYPKLSKLALALEKNLLVTSTLTACAEPYPRATMQNPGETGASREECQPPVNSVRNGVEPPVADADDKDEIMTEVEEADVEDAMTIDMEPMDEMAEQSDTNSTPCENT